MKKILKYWLPPVIWAGVIFTFSSFPTVQTSEFYLGDFFIKKSAHIIEYGILATLIYRALNTLKIAHKKIMFYSVVAAMIYGMTDEIHQMFTPGRGPTIRDVIIDTIGASIFIYGIIGNIKKMPQVLQNLYNTYLI